jgi:hypothetical protein
LPGIDTRARGPYADAALVYYRAGWAPIPVRGKARPVAGFTGKDGAVPSLADITVWSENGFGGWNIGVRLPEHVIGIDMDCYDGKAGAATIADRDARWGKLPPTPCSTSRTDGSRIRFYHVPEGLAWPGDLGQGSGVEIIQRGHRYAVVWPSIHPTTGAIYTWYDAAGEEVDGPPLLDSLAELAAGWVAGLSGGEASSPPVGEQGTAERATHSSASAGKYAGPIPHGSRHTALVSLAGHLRRIDLPFEQATVLILARLADCAQPPVAPTPVTESEAIEKLRDVYQRYSPRGVPDSLVDDGAWPDQPGSERASGQRTVTLTPASSIKIRPVMWLWKDRLPMGSLALLGGREGIGKSLVAYDLTADITRGRLPGIHAGTPRSVIIAATEDSWAHTIVPRLMAAGADLDRVFRIDVTTSEGVNTALSLPRDLAALEAQVTTHDVALVVLDPLMSRLDATLDTHKDAEVRLALEPLVALADRCRAAVLGLIHVNKSGGTDPLNLIMGSRAFAAVARAVLFVVTDPDDASVRLLGEPKNNLGRTDLPTLTFRLVNQFVADTDEGPVFTGRVEWIGETARSLTEVMESTGEGAEHRSATAEAVDWLTDYLTTLGGTAESAEIKREGAKAGHSIDSLKSARRRIKATSENVGFPRRTYWTLPTPAATSGGEG